MGNTKMQKGDELWLIGGLISGLGVYMFMLSSTEPIFHLPYKEVLANKGILVVYVGVSALLVSMCVLIAWYRKARMLQLILMVVGHAVGTGIAILWFVLSAGAS